MSVISSEIPAIKKQWGSLIEACCASSSVPEEFLAALIDNESGGNADACRYEPKTEARIINVLCGGGMPGTVSAVSFNCPGIKHALRREEFLAFISPADISPSTIASGSLARRSFTDCLVLLRFLSVSWGLTQIMGWHTIEFSKTWNLSSPRENLTFALVILAYFANRYQLDVKKDFAPLFACWNTGEPNGKTFDPNYVSNGLARMAEYKSLSQENLT